jgi:hypothetical protein
MASEISVQPITLALIALVQIVLLALITWGGTAYKESRDATRAIAAATAAAHLKSEEKQEDWRRQDEVARRVETAAEAAKDVATQTAAAAKLLVEAQERTIQATQEVARLAAESDARVDKQLTHVIAGNERIHTLVNSDMTEARTAERDQVILTLAALRRVQAMSEKLHVPVTQEEIDTIFAFEARIVTLNQILADRLAAQHQVDLTAAAARGAEMGKRATDPRTAAAITTIQQSVDQIATATTETADTLKQIQQDQKPPDAA